MSERPVAPSLVEKVYLSLKHELFDFHLLPGDRFTETEVAERFQASRTPVWEALVRLEREWYLQMKFRAGWMVKPFDFRQFQELYDLRAILETASLRKVDWTTPSPAIRGLMAVWIVPVGARVQEGPRIYEGDEAFHHTLVAEAGNAEVTKLHQEVTERIRIVRRLGYTGGARLSATYEDHQAILEDLVAENLDGACQRLEAHIASNRAAVETITLGRLEAARSLRTPG